jgi:hypothetical protein
MSSLSLHESPNWAGFDRFDGCKVGSTLFRHITKTNPIAFVSPPSSE